MIQRLFFDVSSLTISPLTIVLVLVIAITALRHRLLSQALRGTTLDAPRVGKDPGHGWIRTWKTWRNLQQAKDDFIKNAKSLTREGYDLYKDSMYWIQTGDMERLVVSSRYIDELRRYPASVLDSRAAVVERNLGWYNGVDLILKTTLHVDVCRTQLVQNLEQVILDQVDVLPDVLKRFLGDPSHVGADDMINGQHDVRYYNAAETMLHMANRCVGRILVGPRLCFNEEWLNACEETTINTGLLCKQLQQYPPFLRPLVNRYLSPSRKVLDRSYRTAERLLENEIQTRRRDEKGENVRKDILQWLMYAKKSKDKTQKKTRTPKGSGQQENEQKLDIAFLTRQVLFVAIAATRSTATAIVHVLFDLAARPHCQEILLSEITDQLAQSGGAWDLAALDRMHRLDSFIKESQRLNPHLLLSFNRKVRQPITLPVLAESTGSGLSSGNVAIPAGTFISTPAYWSARDPAIFPLTPTGHPTGGKRDTQAANDKEHQLEEGNPTQDSPRINNDNDDEGEFQPWRWYCKRREAEATANQHPKDHNNHRHSPTVTPYLSSSTSPDNLYWGYGRNACPGRFLAAAEIKLLVGWMLYHYEICFPPDPDPGCDLVGSTERQKKKQCSTRRPENVFVDERIMPCPRQLIGFVPRRRCRQVINLAKI